MRADSCSGLIGNISQTLARGPTTSFTNITDHCPIMSHPQLHDHESSPSTRGGSRSSTNSFTPFWSHPQLHAQEHHHHQWEEGVDHVGGGSKCYTPTPEVTIFAVSGPTEHCSIFHFPFVRPSVLLRHRRDILTFLDILTVYTMKMIYFLNAYHLGW